MTVALTRTKSRLGKANSTFGRLNNIWENKSLKSKTQMRLCESFALSTALYAADTWPMTIANMKKLEAAHHTWQRKIMGITLRDKITNNTVRERTGMQKIEDILRRKRLRWSSYVYWMDENRISKQALKWSPADGRKKRGRPRKNWNSTVSDDLKKNRYGLGRGGTEGRGKVGVAELCCPMCYCTCTASSTWKE